MVTFDTAPSQSDPPTAKRNQETASSEAPRHVPCLDLSPGGTIQRGNEAAQRMLKDLSGDPVGANLFAYVHNGNLRRLLRDVDRMRDRTLEEAQWILGLRFGNDRWRWYRIVARNRLSSDDVVRLRLWSLDETSKNE